jgi:hypothetical protein
LIQIFASLNRPDFALDADLHVDAGETMASEQKDWLVGLEAKDLWLHKLYGVAIDLDQPVPALVVGHSHRTLSRSQK